MVEIELKVNEYVDITTRHGYKIKGKVVNQSKEYVEVECFDKTVVTMKKNIISIIRKGTKEQIVGKLNKPFFGAYDYQIKPKIKKAKKKWASLTDSNG